ncbi:MAG: hypothetical protein H7099_10130 [Gemmatimonadaceae bacterium]|nr:hypothetical protein [Gemmatimonadaceae bacterium]
MTPDSSRSANATAATPSTASTFVHLSDVVLVLLRARRVLVICGTLGFVAGIAWARVPRSTWTAESTFLPEQRRQSQNALSGLASQIGISVGGLDGSQPGTLFVELARSRDVLDSVSLSAPFVEPGSSGKGKSLTELLLIDDSDPKRRRLALRNRLAAAIDASTNAKTGLVTVRVSLPADWLAAEVANRLVRQLDKISVRIRQRRAESEKLFTDQRMAESARELQYSEQQVTSFQISNRDISTSPARQLELERLNRDASLRQQLFASLANAAQQASLERLRDTPAVTIVQQADLPLQPDRRYLARKVLLAAFGGLAIAMLMTLLRHFWFGERRAASAQLDAEWERSRYDLLRPWRLFFGSSRAA